jgi:hypothetical protein
VKKLLCVLIIYLVITNLYAQPTFSKTYRVDTTFYTEFGSMVVTDSAYYISGVRQDTLNGYWLDRGMLMKIDTNGNKVWAKVYGDTTHTTETWYDAMITTNQGYLANIGRNTFNGTGFLLVTDYDGNIIVDNNYSDTNPILFTGIAQDNSSNFYLFGTLYYQYDSKTILIKTDSLGNEIWRKYYDAFPNGDITGGCFSNDIIIYNNNELLFSAGKQKNDYQQWSYELGTWIVKIDSAGNILNEYQTPTNNRWIRAHVITKTKDNGILFCNTEGVRKINTHLPDYEYLGYVGKLDSSFQLVWEKIYGTEWSQFSHIKEKKNGNLILTGSLYSNLSLDSVRLTGWIMELDENGDSLWQREYAEFSGKWQVHILGDFEILDDKRLLISGYIENLNTTAGTNFRYWGWLIRTDSLGCIVPGCQLLDNTENVAVLFDNDVTVFPNPASEVVTFRFDKAVEEKVEIRVYSGLGQLVGEINVNYSTEGQMNVSDWHSGIYFYGIYVEGVLVKQGQILIEN